jgi:ParB family chromosome partitioning protein
MSEYQNNSIFWVETTKINPNPFQPRKEFEPKSLEDLADSIRQYGVLQPLVVTRKEILRPENDGMDVRYELIAGERRLRASKIAGLDQVPVIIRKETDDKVKLELAIIENLQREDLNPIDRALAFEQLYKQFKLTHVQIGKRMGKSRVYVSNSLRLLSLPEEIKQGLMAGKISEGHTRPLLMLIDRPQEQTTLYKEIMIKKMSVRDAEKVARSIAQDRVRKKEFKIDPRILDYEKKLSENLGTRVHIEPKENGGQITIDYFTLNDLEEILTSMKAIEKEKNMMERYISNNASIRDIVEDNSSQSVHDLMNATGIDINSKSKKQAIQEYHQALSGYSKGKNTDIQEYHQEISAPLENTISDSEDIDPDPMAQFGTPIVKKIESDTETSPISTYNNLEDTTESIILPEKKETKGFDYLNDSRPMVDKIFEDNDRPIPHDLDTLSDLDSPLYTNNVDTLKNIDSISDQDKKENPFNSGDTEINVPDVQKQNM